MERGTFEYQLNRNGVPWQATAYICEHGNNMADCEEGDMWHRATGVIMVNWWNGLPSQMKEREVDRTRLINNG